MERREALKTFAVALGGMISIPAWANRWSADTLPANSFLNSSQKELLTSVVDAIIPKTDTPGAKELGVQNFVELMIQDCLSAQDQKKIKAGLDQASQMSSQSFRSLEKSQQIDILRNVESGSDATLRDTLGTIKNLTIKGYMLCEYVMTNITHYELVPGRYHGCVDLKQ